MAFVYSQHSSGRYVFPGFIRYLAYLIDLVRDRIGLAFGVRYPRLRNPLPLWWRIRVIFTLGIGSRLAGLWHRYPGHWWWVARHPLYRLRDKMFEEGYEYGVRSCVTWIATMGEQPAGMPSWRKALIVGRIEDISDVDGLSQQAAEIILRDPAATGKPGVLRAAAAGVRPHLSVVPPKPRRDPAAPHGYGDDGKPLAPYGLRRDGRPRATKPRLSKPVAKPKQADGTLPSFDPPADSPGRVRRTLRTTLRRVANWLLLGLPRRRALRRARLAEAVQRHPSGIAA